MQVWHLFLLLCLFCCRAQLPVSNPAEAALDLTASHQWRYWRASVPRVSSEGPTQHHPLPGHWAMDYNSACVYPANSLSTEWQFTHQIHISSVWRSAISCGTVPKASPKSKWWHLLVFPYWLFFTRCYWNGRDYFQQMSLKIWKSHRYFDS